MHNSPNTDALSSEFRNFLADIEALLKETANLSGEELAHVRDRIQQRVASAKETAVQFGGEVAEGASNAAAAADREVHAEPWKAIGISTVVGMLLGMFFARR